MIPHCLPPTPVPDFSAAEWIMPRSTTALPDTATLTGDERAQSLLNPRSARVRVAADRPPQWLSPILDRLNQLLSLPPGWDSYSAKQVELAAARRVLDLLVATMADRTPAPQVVPTRQGGVQLEWHQSAIDLEIEVPPSGSLLVSFEDSQGNAQWERTVAHGLGPLIEALQVLTVREVESRG